MRGYAVGSHAARPRLDPTEVLLGPVRRPDRRVLVGAVVAAAALGLAAGAFPAWTVVAVLALSAVLLALRLDLAALAVVAVAPFEQGLAMVLPGPGSWVVAVSLCGVLATSWAVGRRRDRPRVTAASRRVALTLLLAAVVSVAVSFTGPGGGADRAVDMAGRVVPVLLALVVLTALRDRLTPRRVVGVHVAAAVAASALTVVLLLSRTTPDAWDPERLVPWAVTALPLLLALLGGRHPAVAATGCVVLLGAVLLQVTRGVAAPTVVVGLALMLLLAGVTGQLGVRALTGVVALGLLVVGVVPVLAGGPDRAVVRGDGVVVPGVVEVAVLLAAVAVALVAAWPRWRDDRDPVAGAVCTALVGVAATSALGGGLVALPLWLLVALAGAVAARGPGAAAT